MDTPQLDHLASLTVARHITRRSEPSFATISEVVSGRGVTNSEVARIRQIAAARIAEIAQMLHYGTRRGKGVGSMAPPELSSDQTVFVVYANDGEVERILPDAAAAGRFMAMAKDVLHCWVEERPIESVVPHAVVWWEVRWGGTLGDTFNEPHSVPVLSDRPLGRDPHVGRFSAGTGQEGLYARATDQERAVDALREAVERHKAAAALARLAAEPTEEKQ